VPSSGRTVALIKPNVDETRRHWAINRRYIMNEWALQHKRNAARKDRDGEVEGTKFFTCVRRCEAEGHVIITFFTQHLARCEAPEWASKGASHISKESSSR
jgi:hypothetical protein